MRMKNWLATATFAMLAMTATSGNAQAPAACGSGKPITVNLSNATQPVTLDGNYDTQVDFAQISRNMYDGLFKLNDQMLVEPSLATGYSQPDELTYDVALRSGVRFHDGSPFTAADVVSSFNRIASDDKLASKQRTYVSNVKSVIQINDSKVRFILKQPDAAFLRILATVVYITPKGAVEKVGNVAYGKNPIGTGPFKFSSWKQGDSVVLESNCNYWGNKPIPSKVEFRFISEPATQISSLQSGEIDIAIRISPDLANGLKASKDVSVQTVEGNQTVWVSLNTLAGPLSDVRVRQALNYAVDKDAIARQLLHGYATPTGQLYASSVFGHSKSVSPYPYNPQRAKALLKSAGYGADKPLSIEMVNFSSDLNPVWESLATYFSDAGVVVKTRFDQNFFGNWVGKKMGSNTVVLMWISNLLMDADFALGLHLDGARRGLYFQTPETDAGIAQARAISDPMERLTGVAVARSSKRQASYDKLNASLREAAPVVFLYSTKSIYGTSNRIDWKPRSDGAIYLAGVTKR